MTTGDPDVEPLLPLDNKIDPATPFSLAPLPRKIDPVPLAASELLIFTSPLPIPPCPLSTPTLPPDEPVSIDCPPDTKIDDPAPTPLTPTLSVKAPATDC